MNMGVLVNTDADINFILDRSGSMMPRVIDIIGGFNTFIQEQIDLGESDAFVSLFQFDDQHQIDYQSVEVKEVKPLTEKTYQPRGSTALFDAIGRAIGNIERRRNSTPPQDLPGKVMVIIMTDGEDNDSREFDKPRIQQLIDEKTKEGWGFLFVGANIDSFNAAQGMGISQHGTSNYQNSSKGIADAYKGISASVGRSRKSYQAPSTSLAFTDEEQERLSGKSKVCDPNTGHHVYPHKGCRFERKA